MWYNKCLTKLQKIKPVLIELSIALFLNCLFKHFSAKITQCFLYKLMHIYFRKLHLQIELCEDAFMYLCSLVHRKLIGMVFTGPRLFVIILASQ